MAILKQGGSVNIAIESAATYYIKTTGEARYRHEKGSQYLPFVHFDSSSTIEFDEFGQNEKLYIEAISGRVEYSTTAFATNDIIESPADVTFEELNDRVNGSDAGASATAAALSETNAATSETNAATSATSASTSATNASNSASSASTSETNASNSASAAATSEGNALISETNASNSETAAGLSASAAALSATNAEEAWNQAVSDIETKDKAAYRSSVEAASAGKNTVFWDAQGNPNVMVWINKFNSEDINAEILRKTGVDLQLGTGVFPAFIKNGVELRGFWYAKYQASSGIGGGCSVIAGVQPKTSVNYDQARALCVNKGVNWHMASNLEWCAVSFLSLAYGQNVRGNTNYGRSHAAKYETARRGDILAPGDTAGTARTDCGTGPATWSHDGTIFGVFDLVGNVWEWVDQLLMQEGQIISPLDNDPALLEAQWTSHATYLDSAAATSGAVILNSVITNRTGALGDNGSGNGYNFNTWAVTAKDASYVESTLMRQMAIESASAINLEGRIYSRNFGERAPVRGGDWSSGSSAGQGALSFVHSRAFAYSSFGFRPALFES